MYKWHLVFSSIGPWKFSTAFSTVSLDNDEKTPQKFITHTAPWPQIMKQSYLCKQKMLSESVSKGQNTITNSQIRFSSNFEGHFKKLFLQN